MKAIRFDLSGRTAMFKKPDVNLYYFTYNNIHKIALLGILGSILGLGGYTQQNNKILDNCKKGQRAQKDFTEETRYPEFYQKLKDLKVSIFPQEKGYFTKKIQVFNNCVGYASKEQGGNLVVHEQWLENPKWTIYILDDNSIDEKLYQHLEDYLLNSKCEFIPYLGKNDHAADIGNCKVVELEKSNLNYINSLFINENVEIGSYQYDEEEMPFFFKEIAPYSMNEEYNFYEFREFVMTNKEISNVKELDNIYCTNGTSLAFF